MTENNLQLIVGSNIRTLRTSKGIRQHELAARCNMEKASLSRIESGKTNLTLSTLQRLAAELQVEPVTLLFSGVLA